MLKLTSLAAWPLRPTVRAARENRSLCQRL